MTGRSAKPLTVPPVQGRSAPAVSPEEAWAALSAAGCAVYSWNLVTDRMTWSPNAARMLGLKAGEMPLVTGSDFLATCGLGGREGSYHGFSHPAPRDGTAYEAVCQLRLDGASEDIWVMDQGRWFAGLDGAPARALGTIRRLPPGLARESGNGFDALTGIPTRRHLLEALEAIRQSWSLLLVGLDDLGGINERFGFQAADRLIVALARRLRARLQSQDLLVRFSGNKFAILVPAASASVATAFGEALIADIRATPLFNGEGATPVSITIGAICAPAETLPPDQIISRLQEAHERAKRLGRGRFVLDQHSGAQEGRRLVNLRMADEIIQALDHNHVQVALQPVVHAASRALAFSEALARIPTESGQHRYGGQRLVGAAERLGLMGGLDRCVLQKVAATMRQNPALSLSVNVSVLSIADEAWMRLFQAEVTPDIGQRLIIELTESVTVDDLPAARQFITAVRERGVRIAIDDFGAGATSFRNLRKLDVDILKIDGSFVLHMIKSADDRAFVRALLALAQQMNIQTVAEWVQNETAAAMLLEWGCDYFQGALSGLAQPLREPAP